MDLPGFIIWARLTGMILLKFVCREPIKSAVGARLMVAFTFEDIEKTTITEQANWWVQEYNPEGDASTFISRALHYDIDHGMYFAFMEFV